MVLTLRRKTTISGLGNFIRSSNCIRCCSDQRILNSCLPIFGRQNPGFLKSSDYSKLLSDQKVYLSSHSQKWCSVEGNSVTRLQRGPNRILSSFILSPPVRVPSLHLKNYQSFGSQLSFSTRGGFESNGKKRYEFAPWMDKSRSIENRVDSFVSLMYIGPEKFVYPTEILDLIKSCCKKRSFHGMELAMQILKKLYSLKREMLKSVNVSVYDPTMKLTMRRLHLNPLRNLVFIDISLVREVMFGWVKMSSGRDKILKDRMDALFSMAIAEAVFDREQFLKYMPTIEKYLEEARLDYADSLPTDNSSDIYPGSTPNLDFCNTYLLGLSTLAKKFPEILFDYKDFVRITMTQTMNQTNGWHTKPNTITFHTLLKAHANAGRSIEGVRAYYILMDIRSDYEKEMKKYNEQFDIPYDPFNWKRTNKRRLVYPDLLMHTITMQALLNGSFKRQEYARVMRVTNYALELFNRTLEMSRLEQLDDDDSLDIATDTSVPLDLIIDDRIFALALKALSMQIEHTKDIEERLAIANTGSYVFDLLLKYHNLVNKNHTDSNTSGQLSDISENDANEIGSSMDERKRFRVRPDGLNAYIGAWAMTGSKDAPERCEEVLDQIISDYSDNDQNQTPVFIVPDSVTFKMCTKAWIKSSSHYENVGDRAERLLNKHLNFCESGILPPENKPDEINFAQVIQAYSLYPNQLSKANDLLQRMIRLSQEGKIDTSASNNAPFDSIIMLASKYPKHYELGEMNSGSEDTGFTNVVNINDDPYTFVMQLYDDLVENRYNLNTRMDHSTYHAMLLCVHQHCNPRSVEFEKTSRLLFDAACEAGQVSDAIWKLLLKMKVSGGWIAEVLDSGHKNASWQRNVTQRKFG